MLDALFGYCFPILERIGWKLDEIEDAIFEARTETSVRDISNVKQEIIAYRKIVSPQRPVLRQLDRDTRRFLTEDLEIYYDDLIDSSEKIWDTLDNYKEVVEALEHTNESLIADRQNRVLRILTVLSATMLPLTFVTGLFGMNVARVAAGRGPRTSGYLRVRWPLLGVFRWARWLCRCGSACCSSGAAWARHLARCGSSHGERQAIATELRPRHARSGDPDGNALAGAAGAGLGDGEAVLEVPGATTPPARPSASACAGAGSATTWTTWAARSRRPGGRRAGATWPRTSSRRRR